MRLLDHSPESVAIVGMGPSIGDLFTEVMTQEFSMQFAEEIWAINMAANLIRHDVVFWMDDLERQDKFRPGLMSALRHFDKPVITSTSYPSIVPLSYDYPINPIALMALPIWGKPYLNNGVAQAIAYAIWKGVKVIKLYGCDFSYPDRDYAESGRACVESWITVATGRGIEVQLCPRTSLMDAVKDKGIYGYHKQPEITMLDGSAWQFQSIDVTPKQPGQILPDRKPKIQTADSGYAPEDSSGAPPKEQSVPGILANAG